MNILITYATLTGNTALVADHLSNWLQSNTVHDVDLIDSMELEPSSMENYDLIVFGASTWGEGDLNEISEIFFEMVAAETDLNLESQSFVMFGLGDRAYANFCGCIKHYEQKFAELGAKQVNPSFEIDGYPDESVLSDTVAWLESALATISQDD